MAHQDDLSILQDYIDRCSNWGRWGPDDELGTVNLITQGKVREAAALVKVGKTISLTMPYDSRGPQNGYLGRANPHLYQLTSGPGYLAGEQYCAETPTLATLRKSTGQPTAGYYDDVLVMPTVRDSVGRPMPLLLAGPHVQRALGWRCRDSGQSRQRRSELHRQDRHPWCFRRHRRTPWG